MPFLYNIAYCNNTVVILCSVLMHTDNLHSISHSAYLQSVGEANITRSSKHVQARSSVWSETFILHLSTQATGVMVLVGHLFG